ncbi:glycosyltransferase family 1 protein [Rhodocyclus tenuis]|uniref:Glycosyltransferase family 1 protein n=1 Tax=Rhodocyclus gracilis TaxID=2929842 RepID=A0ABX0WKJ9_9RHOO|nr:glycosyltransferase family 1 protein [Rhodocyclus gracilis]NJA89826.1 glycosyltransferase family 1 protein [Rhodocyclus gracilis]
MSPLTDCRESPLPPLDIVIVSETYPPEVNGVAMTIGRLVDGLRTLGHRVRIVRPRQPTVDGTADAGGSPNAVAAGDILLPGLPLPGYAGLRFGLPARTRLLAAWRAERPDIVHVVTEGPLGSSAVTAARTLGIPVTSGFHTNFDRYSRHYGVGWLQPLVAGYLRRFHRRTRLTLVPTATLAESLAGAGLSGVRVVGRGVDCHLFDPARRSAELRAAWGVDTAAGEGLAVSYVGRLAAEKNLDLVLLAFAAIRQRRPTARLILVGDGPLRARLQRRFGPQGSEADPAIIFAGQRLGEDLATHYASADIFLFPSLTETFGNVTQEALASGLAVLAFRSAAAAEMIVDGENGRTAAVGDEAAFIRAAVQLTREEAIRRRLAVRARQSVLERDWDGIACRFVAVMREAIHLREDDALPAAEAGAPAGV